MNRVTGRRPATYSNGGAGRSIWARGRPAANSDRNALITLSDGSTLSFIGLAPDDLREDDFFVDSETIPRFTPGTMIRTARGLVPVEALRLGDLVATLDHGMKPVRRLGRHNLNAQYLRHSPALWPVRIAAGALGKGCPVRDLVVSPGHRVVVAGPVVQMCTGDHEVPVAAKDLVGQPGVTQAMPGTVSYIHVMFDGHQIIESDGAWTESFQPTKLSFPSMDKTTRDEILALFPEPESDIGSASNSVYRGGTRI